MLTPFELLRDDLKRVESEIIKNFYSDVSLIPQIGKHIFSSGGKRFRPALLILSSRLFKPDDTRCIPLAGVVELIHTATLLHDDVVDKAELRRGKKSANSLWGNGASILVGDFFFSQAVLLMIGTGDMRLLTILTDATKKMSEGEVFGLSLGRSIDIAEEQYMRLIHNKTAVLISAACRIGAILGGATDREHERLKKFGQDVGTAFQLVDDVLDYEAHPDDIGKPVGGDFYEQKATLPLIHALARIDDAGRKRITEIFYKEKKDNGDFHSVSGLIRAAGGITYTLAQARRFIESAKGELGEFADSREKRALLQLADYVIERGA
jgi:octaprenyl-diphosphate synthase